MTRVPGQAGVLLALQRHFARMDKMRCVCRPSPPAPARRARAAWGAGMRRTRPVTRD